MTAIIRPSQLRPSEPSAAIRKRRTDKIIDSQAKTLHSNLIIIPPVVQHTIPLMLQLIDQSSS